MITLILMGIILLAIAASTLVGMHVDQEKDSFMSLSDSAFLRGFWCIIVMLVHVPAAYQNPLQDMVGSFAYIGVTFFFMTSSFGLKFSLTNKSGYMDHFWRRRLPPILIPAVIANAFSVLTNAINGGQISILSFLNINNWVKVLLLYYFVFWIIYKILPRKLSAGTWQDIAMCSTVLLFSLIDRLTPLKITSIWIVEPLGFAYGIIAANKANLLKQMMKNNWLIKSGVLMIIAALVGVCYLKYKPVPFVGDYFIKVILGISIIAFMFEVISKLKVGNMVNAFLGSISYEVYILHFGVYSLVSAVSKGRVSSGLYIIISIVITLILAYLLRLICKPLIKAVHG